MATAGLSLKLVVEASRGAVIAVHAAGGLARGHVQALRFLRAAEGLCRSAVAVLQAVDSKKTKGKGKDNDKKDTGKGKGKDSDEGMGVAPTVPGAQPRRRRRGRARAAAAPAVVPEFDDSWADGVRVAAPPAQPLALPLRAAAGEEGGPPLDDAAVRGRRPLIVRRSGSRSPRRLSPDPAAALSSLALLAGRVATIKGLVSRPELDTSVRWICHVKGGEQLRILPEKPVPNAENGQKFSRLRDDSS